MNSIKYYKDNTTGNLHIQLDSKDIIHLIEGMEKLNDLIDFEFGGEPWFSESIIKELKNLFNKEYYDQRVEEIRATAITFNDKELSEKLIKDLGDRDKYIWK